MRGVVFTGERQIELMEFPDPTPGPGEVVVEMKASGMCGSDLHQYRRPKSGGEAIGGLPVVSSHKKMWLARPAPAGKPCYQILPIDWDIITKAGGTATNYQIFPGDRIYIGPDPLVLTDNTLAKVFAPIERIFGITLLGSATVQSFRFNHNNGNGFFTPFF